jgi:hypothetical protein
MGFKLNSQELALMQGTPEVITMLRNRVLVDTDLVDTVQDFLEVNAQDLWHSSGRVFYFLNGIDYGNVMQIQSNPNQKF